MPYKFLAIFCEKGGVDLFLGLPRKTFLAGLIALVFAYTDAGFCEEAPPATKSRPVGEPEVKLASTNTKAESKLFGHYRLSLGASKPTFTDIDEYDKFYGDTRPMPALQVDYYFFDWFATLGLTFRLNFYKDEGHAVKGNTLRPDDLGTTELTLVPLQAGIALQGTPFRAKWIVLNGWFGAEATFFQEVRRSEKVSEEGETTDSTETEGEVEDEGQEVNSGWKYASAMGFSASFLMNYLDNQATSSLRNIGIGGVYFTPYIEIITAPKKNLTFSRRSYGLAFTFETI